MFKVLHEKRVFKDLDKIPEEDVKKILRLIEELSSNPRPPSSKKLSGKASFYRIRQGDYRIIYEMKSRAREIRIILIRHRSEAYRGL
jgi:mRNA interferase RelE/StbE